MDQNIIRGIGLSSLKSVGDRFLPGLTASHPGKQIALGYCCFIKVFILRVNNDLHMIDCGMIQKNVRRQSKNSLVIQGQILFRETQSRSTAGACSHDKSDCCHGVTLGGQL